MLASTAARLTGKFVRADGEAGVVISRIVNATTNPPTAVFQACQAFIRNYRPNELGPGIVQGDSNVTILGSVLPALAQAIGSPPRRNDKITINGLQRNIEGAEIIKVGSQVVRVNLLVRG